MQSLLGSEVKPKSRPADRLRSPWSAPQALHQLEAADNSGDGKLTLNEMISNPYVFYGSSGVRPGLFIPHTLD